jgi:hypothetical protein
MVGVGVNEGSGVKVSVGAVVFVGDIVNVGVNVGAGELQADAMKMTMMNNTTNLIVGFIFFPFLNVLNHICIFICKQGGLPACMPE